jgi:hypothetical protein
MSTIKLLKKDAIIPVQIGAGFIQKLQSMLMSLVDERTEQELEIFKKLAENGQELSEPWMEHVQLLMILLNEIDKAAEANGFTYESSVDDAINQQES